MKDLKERGKDEEVNGQGGKRGAPAPHEWRSQFIISYLNAYLNVC